MGGTFLDPFLQDEDLQTGFRTSDESETGVKDTGVNASDAYPVSEVFTEEIGIVDTLLSEADKFGYSETAPVPEQVENFAQPEIITSPGLWPACDRVRKFHELMRGATTKADALTKWPEFIKDEQGRNRQVDQTPKIKAIKDKLKKDLEESKIQIEQIRKDRVLISKWLVKRATELGNDLVANRTTLTNKLESYYESDASVNSLAEDISIMMSYRIGLPLMRTKSTPDIGIFEEQYFPASAVPTTKTDLGKQVWEPRVSISGGPFPKATVWNENEAGLRLKWGKWSDVSSHNQSPFEHRFAEIGKIYGRKSVKAWRRDIYFKHPITVLAHLKFGGSAKIYKLCDAIRDTHASDRLPVMREFIDGIVSELRTANSKLKSDLAPNESWSDYVDWGNHKPLLYLAASELTSDAQDDLFLAIKEDIITKLDPWSYKDIFSAILVTVGILAMIVTLGAMGVAVGTTGAVMISGSLFAVDVALTSAGVLLSAAELYDSLQYVQQGKEEELFKLFDKKLVGFETDASVGSATSFFALEIFLTVLFPPARGALKGGVRAAPDLAQDIFQRSKTQADVNFRGLPTSSTDEMLDVPVDAGRAQVKLPEAHAGAGGKLDDLQDASSNIDMPDQPVGTLERARVEMPAGSTHQEIEVIANPNGTDAKGTEGVKGELIQDRSTLKIDAPTRRQIRAIDALETHGITLNGYEFENLLILYRQYEKLALDKNTMKELVSLNKILDSHHMLNRRAAAEEFVTLRMLNENPNVARIKLLKASKEARAADYEVLMGAGDFKGELRQVEVRTITRSRWDSDVGMFVDTAFEELKDYAAARAADSKLRRSATRSSYTKRQVYDRGYIEVHIWGEAPAEIMAPTQITNLAERMRTRSNTVEGIYFNWKHNGEAKRLFVKNPRFRVAGLD
jgi:hypothetical protein